MTGAPWRRVDVLIVGGGPTGLLLGNFLGRDGVRTLVAERNRGTVEEPRAVSIDDESLRALQAVDLLPAILPDLNQGYGVHYLSAAKRCFLKVEPSVREYGYPRRNACRQPLLEARLREGLARFAAVETSFATTLESFAQDGDGVTAAVRTRDGALRTVRAKWLVGADGGRSTVRKVLGVQMRGSSFEQRWLVLDTVNDTDDYFHTRVVADPARPSINLPGPHRTRRWEFMLHPGETEEEMLRPDRIEALLRQEGRTTPVEIARKIVYTFHARLAERWRVGRVFLAGDAAHLTPPFAGQGMNAGLRDATNLAWKLAAVANGRLGPGLLAHYETERREHAWAMIELAILIGKVMAPRDRLDAWRKEWLFRLAACVPSVRDYFAQMKFKPKPRFARGYLIADARPARRTLVGRMFPQPEVITAQGERVLLDTVLGNGFALLYWLDGEASAPTFGHPLWQRLQARRIAVARTDGPSSATREWATVHDASATFPRLLAGDRGKVLLLRPDRYVAAAFLPAEEARVADTLDALSR